MYERFTDRARMVMRCANQEAQRFNHEYIGTEHILLGLVKEGSGVAANVLKNLGIDLTKVRVAVEKLVQTGPHTVTKDKLPQTPRAQKVIEYAMEEARRLNHNYVGTEHILLGLLRQHDGVAAQVLMSLGLNLEAVRAEILELLGFGSSLESSKENRPVADSGQLSGVASESLTPDARRVVELAMDQARALDHGCVSTGHLLLAILQSSDKASSEVIEGLGLTYGRARQNLEELFFELPPWPAGDEAVHTERLVRAIKRASEEARLHSPTRAVEQQIESLRGELDEAVLNQKFEEAGKLRDQIAELKRGLPKDADQVAPAHLLLGLLGDPQCAAVRIIRELGVDPEQVRTEILRRLRAES